jgi:hypothetical protein
MKGSPSDFLELALVLERLLASAQWSRSAPPWSAVVVVAVTRLAKEDGAPRLVVAGAWGQLLGSFHWNAPLRKNYLQMCGGKFGKVGKGRRY